MIHSLYKKNKNNKISWVDNVDYVGEFLFTFDNKKIFNLFSDYPWKLSAEEKEIFDKENPYWAKCINTSASNIIFTFSIVNES